MTVQGKPSPKAPKKRRFFQLSHDGSTLRWSWNKYVVMYYVEVKPVMTVITAVLGCFVAAS